MSIWKKRYQVSPDSSMEPSPSSSESGMTIGKLLFRSLSSTTHDYAKDYLGTPINLRLPTTIIKINGVGSKSTKETSSIFGTWSVIENVDYESEGPFLDYLRLIKDLHNDTPEHEYEMNVETFQNFAMASNWKQKTSEQSYNVLKELQKTIEDAIHNKTKRIILIGMSHGAFLMRVALQRLKAHYPEHPRKWLHRVAFIAISPVRYVEPFILPPHKDRTILNECGWEYGCMNVYHFCDPMLNQLKLPAKLMGLTCAPGLDDVVKMLNREKDDGKTHLRVNNKEMHYYMYNKGLAAVVATKWRFVPIAKMEKEQIEAAFVMLPSSENYALTYGDGKLSIADRMSDYHASLMITYPLFGHRTAMNLNDVQIQEINSVFEAEKKKRSWVFDLFNKSKVKPLGGGVKKKSTNKQRIVIPSISRSRSYSVRYARNAGKDADEPYVVIKQARVPLKSIRGRYRYTKNFA